MIYYNMVYTTLIFQRCENQTLEIKTNKSVSYSMLRNHELSVFHRDISKDKMKVLSSTTGTQTYAGKRIYIQ